MKRPAKHVLSLLWSVAIALSSMVAVCVPAGAPVMPPTEIAISATASGKITRIVFTKETPAFRSSNTGWQFSSSFHDAISPIKRLVQQLEWEDSKPVTLLQFIYFQYYSGNYYSSAGEI